MNQGFIADFTIKSVDKYQHFNIFFSARGYISEAAFMNSRDGASSCPHIHPCVTSAEACRGASEDRRA
jgi:hypothetical protein